MENTNEKLAVAIGYDQEQDRAPRVLAKGRGILAEMILEIARMHRIPLQRDPAVAQLLNRLKVDQEIPVGLYKAVAEILAFVYQMNERQR